MSYYVVSCKQKATEHGKSTEAVRCIGGVIIIHPSLMMMGQQRLRHRIAPSASTGSSAAAAAATAAAAAAAAAASGPGGGRLPSTTPRSSTRGSCGGRRHHRDRDRDVALLPHHGQHPTSSDNAKGDRAGSSPACLRGVAAIIMLVIGLASLQALSARSSADITSLIPPSVARTLQAVGGGLTSGGAEAPFVVTHPDGLAVRRTYRSDPDPSYDGLVGTLPFGSVVVLAEMRRWSPYVYVYSSSPRTIMRMVYPYDEGYVDVQGSAKPLVGNIGTETSVEKGAAKDRDHKEQPCCSSRDSEKDNVTWHDYRSGTYSAEGASPQWTIQYQPASASASESSPWMAPTWLDQVPIGTGRHGAIVGSTASASVIPISTAGLFVPPAAAVRTSSKVNAKDDAKGPPVSARTTREPMLDDGKFFAAAREALLRGDHDQAKRLIGQMQAESSRENPFASLEYAADLVLAFTADPVQFRQEGRNLHVQRRLKRTASAERVAGRMRRKGAAAKGAAARASNNRSKGRQRDGTARGALIESLISGIVTDVANGTAAGGMEDGPGRNFPAPMHQLLGRGHLDVRRGVYRESFVTSAYFFQDSNNDPAELRPHTNTSSTSKAKRRLHHREYFAALEDHIIAARLQCRELPSSMAFMDRGGFGGLFSRPRKQTPSCLNIVAAIARTDAGKSSVSSRVWSVIPSANQTQEEGTYIKEKIVAGSATDGEFIVRQKISRLGMKRTGNSLWPQISRGIFGVSIHPNSDSPGLAPSAEVCGVLTCRGGESMIMNISEDGKAICSSTSSAEIFLAIELQSRGNDMAGAGGIVRSPQELKLDCQKRLLRALEDGYEKLRELHASKFDKVMSGMDFSLIDTESNDGCDGRDFSVDPSTNLHCGTKESTSSANALSPSLLRRQFQFSRYLLLSSAASSVPNLQFWVDGPVSAWSGE